MTTGSIRIAMTSDVGLRRKNNQDTGFAQQGVFMVCDGMGGGMGGEQASQLAAQHFAQLAAIPSRTRQDIDDTLARAQHDILDLGDRLGGVAGTTCSGLVLPQDHADSASARSAALFSDADDQDFSDQTYVVNVGDSRTYHLSPLAHADAPATDIIPVWDAASLTRITRDHSQRQEAIDSGQMLPEEAEATIPRNIITQCLGDPDGIMPDVYVADLTGRFIICSDGLHGEVPDEQIAAIAAAHSSPQEAVDALVAAAGHAGTVGAGCVAPGQVVVDVGINWDEKSQRLVGDVDFDAAEPVVAAITPVPGGVGAVTTAILAKHVIEAAERAAAERSVRA